MDFGTTWSSFKHKVELLFGLSMSRQIWVLYQMKPLLTETTATFVKHVENECLALGTNEDACMYAQCYRL